MTSDNKMSAKSYVIDALRSPATKGWWRWIIASPFLMVLFEYLAVAPIGSHFFLWLELPFILGFLAAIIAVVVFPFLLMFRKLRKTALAWLLASLCFFPLAFGGFILGEKIRSSAFHDLAERSTPLVSAIFQYTDDHGALPKSLGELVPDYLSEIPQTGIMAYSDYRYYVGEKAERYEGNPWILIVSTPSGGINFDKFMYFPLQNYPERGYSGYFERIHEWAYLPE